MEGTCRTLVGRTVDKRHEDWPHSHERNPSRARWDALLPRPGQTDDASPWVRQPGSQGRHWSGSRGPEDADGPADTSRTRSNGDGRAWELNGPQMMGYHHYSRWIQSSSDSWPFPSPIFSSEPRRCRVRLALFFGDRFKGTN